MWIEIALAAGSSLLAAWLLTGMVRRAALAGGIVDRPNARSSHTQVTPRGGGLAIVVVFTAALAILHGLGRLPPGLALAMVGSLPVAWIGLVDDRSSVPPLTRFAVHVMAAGWAVYALGGLPPLQWGSGVADLGVAGNLLAVVAIVWVINLFNFMDGIDGIAAGEAIFICAIGGWLSYRATGSPGLLLACVTLCGACGGFLGWNAPPARIFLGDVGSGYLGYVVAVLALASAQGSPTALFEWLILGGIFFVDATVTVIRRALRGAAVYQPHREHAYQWLSRRWRSHLRVDLVLLAVSLAWLAPLAWYAAEHPSRAASIALAALIPLVSLTWWAGSGRPE
jgi:Fuc2NAc and GlcNAc transferase